MRQNLLVQARRGTSDEKGRKVLAYHLSWLPLPYISLWDNVTQTWELEVKGDYQSLLICRLSQYPTPSSLDLARVQIDCSIPVWLLKMDWVEHSIGHA